MQKSIKHLMLGGLLFVGGSLCGSDTSRGPSLSDLPEPVKIEIYCQPEGSERRDFTYTFDMEELGSSNLKDFLNNAEEKTLNLAGMKDGGFDNETLGALYDLHKAVYLGPHLGKHDVDKLSLDKQMKRFPVIVERNRTREFEKCSAALQLKLLNPFNFWQIGDSDFVFKRVLDIMNRPSVGKELLALINQGALDSDFYSLRVSECSNKNEMLLLVAAIVGRHLDRSTSWSGWCEYSGEVQGFRDTLELVEKCPEIMPGIMVNFGSGSSVTLTEDQGLFFGASVSLVHAGSNYAVAQYQGSPHPTVFFDKDYQKRADLGETTQVYVSSDEFVTKNLFTGTHFSAVSLLAVSDSIDRLSVREVLLLKALLSSFDKVAVDKQSRAHELFTQLPKATQERIEKMETVEFK